MRRLGIDVGPGEYSVAKLDASADVPAGLLGPTGGALVSITRTGTEVSVICPSALWEAVTPDPAAPVDAGWRLLTVRGPLEFTLTGILAALASELASAGVALFSMSTFDTDHLLVKQSDLVRAVAALREAGHDVRD